MGHKNRKTHFCTKYSFLDKRIISLSFLLSRQRIILLCALLSSLFSWKGSSSNSLTSSPLFFGRIWAARTYSFSQRQNSSRFQLKRAESLVFCVGRQEALLYCGTHHSNVSWAESPSSWLLSHPFGESE